MRSYSLFPILALSLLAACGPGNADSSQVGGSLALTSGPSGATPDGIASTAISVPHFVYPEKQKLSIEREVQVRDATGALVRVQELLQADGTGNMRLDVLGSSADLTSPFIAPSGLLLLEYSLRMRFLVNYRDPHLGEFAAVAGNFRWTKHAGFVSVAGVDCVRYTAKSLHDLGNVEFLAAAQTNLLLGWTYYANNGEILIKLESTVLDFNPDLTGVVWSKPIVAEQAYAGSSDRNLLGFTPEEPLYLPPGFFRQNAWLRFSQGLFPGMSDMLVNVYSDGIHLVFLAQHDQQSFSSGIRIANRIATVRETDLGGIRVAEGQIGKRMFYVASLLNMEEIETIFGSLAR